MRRTRLLFGAHFFVNAVEALARRELPGRISKPVELFKLAPHTETGPAFLSSSCRHGRTPPRLVRRLTSTKFIG